MSYFAQELRDALRDPEIRGEYRQLLGEALAIPEMRDLFVGMIREALTEAPRPWSTQEAATALCVSVQVFNNWVNQEPELRDLATKKGNVLLWPCRETKAYWDRVVVPRLRKRK